MRRLLFFIARSAGWILRWGSGFCALLAGLTLMWEVAGVFVEPAAPLHVLLVSAIQIVQLLASIALYKAGRRLERYGASVHDDAWALGLAQWIAVIGIMMMGCYSGNQKFYRTTEKGRASQASVFARWLDDAQRGYAAGHGGRYAKRPRL